MNFIFSSLSSFVKVLFFLYLLFFFQLIFASPFVVVIDAGHGGKDPGAIGGNLKEKNINLSVALKLGNLIENSGKDIKVVYTRKTDIFVELSQRTAISNKAHADLFISIHSNASRSSSARGIETYIMGMEKTQANLNVALRENSVITQEDSYATNYEGYDPSSSESFIIFSLQQNAYQNESLRFASSLQNNYIQKIGTLVLDKGVKQANFLVLWKTSAPSVLTEIGFISNPTDRAFISSASGQNLIAQSLFDALISFISDRDSENNTSETPLVSSYPDYSHSEIKKSQNNEVTSNLIYKIQVLATSNPVIVNRQNFFSWSDRISTSFDGNIFKYFILGSNVLKETLTLQDSVRKNFPDCFIVPFNNGKSITINEARKIEANGK